jgi:hypothetical protein
VETCGRLAGDAVYRIAKPKDYGHPIRGRFRRPVRTTFRTSRAGRSGGGGARCALHGDASAAFRALSSRTDLPEELAMGGQAVKGATRPTPSGVDGLPALRPDGRQSVSGFSKASRPDGELSLYPKLSLNPLAPRLNEPTAPGIKTGTQ